MTRPRTAPAWILSCVLLACVSCGSGDVADSVGQGEDEAPTLAARRARRAELEATVWAREMLAQEHERALVVLWDALLDAGRRRDVADKARILGSVEFESIRLGTPVERDKLDHGIVRSGFDGAPTVSTQAQWAERVQGFADAGYELVQSEWHHANFVPAHDDVRATSRIAVVLHVLDPARARRLIVEGELGVEWSGQTDADGVPIPARIDATGLRMLERAGPAVFERLRTYALKRNRRLATLHPIMVYDLDGDGLSEIAMLGAGRVLRNRGGGQFEEAELFAHPYELAEAAVIADMNGDGHPDLVSSRSRGDVVVYFGDANGRFPDEPRISPRFKERLLGPSVMTAGDVDLDGDLDIWLAQYKPPYLFGQMPTPFYDANDGWPASLLLNDGTGRFVLATEEAGLADKRLRRTYASSLIDLDEDSDLDLLVVSDFSGVDLHENDGTGHFVDATSSFVADRHLFGMSSSFADYDLDGRIDIFVAGMASTTARRLEAAGLERGDRPEASAMRMRMAYGNRMYLADDAGWKEPSFHADVARTGWTWGTTAFDFDNDGDPDLFAANGNESGESTKDYCVKFWCHDVFEGDSEPDEELENLFSEELSGFSDRTESWDGYQKNHLLMNQGGRGFVNIAFLMGVADEFDSRSAISDDLDLDGRVDLVVVEDQGIRGQRLHILRNRMETPNRFVGVQLREEAGGPSPVGAVIRLTTSEGTQVRHITTGDSVMGQHSTNVHFGLGPVATVEAIEVRWINGQARALEAPASGRYHFVTSQAD
jgi:hypothetical protein